MTDRVKQVLLAGLFWLAFGIPTFFIVAFLPVCIGLYACGNDAIRDWVYRVGKALDQLCNAALFNGFPQETISSHTGRYVKSGLPMPWKFRFVRWLTDLFEKDHAIKAIEPPFAGLEL
jgi:hypothetical protein